MSLGTMIIRRLAVLSALLLPVTAMGAADPVVAEALKAKGVRDPEIISWIDLTAAFSARSNWSLAIVQERTPRNPQWHEHGPLFVCFLKAQSPACLDAAGSPLRMDAKEEPPFNLYEARIVHAGPDGQEPGLLVKT